MADSGPLKVDDLVELFGVERQFAEDWFTTRKGKGQKVLTQSAWRLLCKGAAAVGISPAEAVQFCAEHETWGFHPEQYRKDNRGRAAPQQREKSFTEAATQAKQRRIAEMTGRPIAGDDHGTVIELH
jgi:hypothetical protein